MAGITVTIQIGNSDNKLSQEDWSSYVQEIRETVEGNAHEIHFFGGSPTWYRWQNVAWVAVIPNDRIEELKQELRRVRNSYNQDSVAFTPGGTEFV